MHIKLSKQSVIPNTQSYTTKQYTNKKEHITIAPKYRIGNKIIIMIIIIKKNNNNNNNNKMKQDK